MPKAAGICVHEQEVVNVRQGEIWGMIREDNPSTGYQWKLLIDDSGVYELIEDKYIPPKEPIPGAPGERIWVFQAIHSGIGEILMQKISPSGEIELERRTEVFVA